MKDTTAAEKRYMIASLKLDLLKELSPKGLLIFQMIDELQGQIDLQDHEEQEISSMMADERAAS